MYVEVLEALQRWNISPQRLCINVQSSWMASSRLGLLALILVALCHCGGEGAQTTSCETGFLDNDEGGCADIDECATDNGGCDDLTTCTNTQGSFTCGACPAGYTGDGATGCADIDECATDNGGCHPSSTCTNLVPGRECSCPTGISGILTIDGHALSYTLPANFTGNLVYGIHGYDMSGVLPPLSQVIETELLDAGTLVIYEDSPDVGWTLADDVAVAVQVRAEAEGELTGCTVNQALVVGVGMGGLGALMLAEELQGKGVFDGALALCAPAMGVSRFVDMHADNNVAYTAINSGFPSEWGSSPFLMEAGLDYETDVAASLLAQLQSSPFQPYFEFLRLVTGETLDGYYTDPGRIFERFWWSTEMLSHWQALAGGQVAQAPLSSAEHDRLLSSNERSYLNSIGFNNTTIDSLLRAMGAVRGGESYLESAPRRALYQMGELSGHLAVPVVALFSTLTDDPAAYYLADYATASASSSMVYARHTLSLPQCLFSDDQMSEALAALESWVQTTTPPVEGDFATGFQPESYAPARPKSYRNNVWVESVTTVEGDSGQSVATLTLRRSSTDGAFTIAFATADKTATAGSDYLAVDSTIAFADAGDLTAEIEIGIVGDTSAESTEEFELNLSLDSGDANVITPVVVVTIEDND